MSQQSCAHQLLLKDILTVMIWSFSFGYTEGQSVPRSWPLLPNAFIQMGDQRSPVSKAQGSSNSGQVCLLHGNPDPLILQADYHMAS